MGTWLKRVWTDEEAFKTFTRKVGQFALVMLGAYAPLLVDSKYAWYAGPALMAFGISIPSKPLAPKA